jgi:hypothetical protein
LQVMEDVNAVSLLLVAGRWTVSAGIQRALWALIQKDHVRGNL